jgi:hypothetical protein
MELTHLMLCISFAYGISRLNFLHITFLVVNADRAKELLYMVIYGCFFFFLFWHTLLVISDVVTSVER